MWLHIIPVLYSETDYLVPTKNVHNIINVDIGSLDSVIYHNLQLILFKYKKHKMKLFSHFSLFFHNVFVKLFLAKLVIFFIAYLLC